MPCCDLLLDYSAICIVEMPSIMVKCIMKPKQFIQTYANYQPSAKDQNFFKILSHKTTHNAMLGLPDLNPSEALSGNSLS